MTEVERTHDLASTEALDEERLSAALEMRYNQGIIYT
jgi:myosin heavy subunit